MVVLTTLAAVHTTSFFALVSPTFDIPPPPTESAVTLARFASILLTLAFLGLGTGGLEFLHNLQHQHEDAQEALIARQSNQQIPPAPTHDESNCPIHFQLHLPIFFAGWVPLFIALGLFVSFLTLLAPPLISRRATIRLDCRGPPSCT